MNLPQFLEQRQASWEELDELLATAGRRVERLGPEGVLRLGSLYRAAAADLAYARRRFPGDPVVDRLERLVIAGRSLVYERPARRRGLIDFLADGYWRLLWQRRRPIALASALLLVPWVMAALWAASNPETVAASLPPEFLWVAEATTTDQGYSAAELAGFSTFVFTNNVRVALLAFALGITIGLGTSAVLLQNGLVLGGVTGLALEAGNGGLLVAAVAAHGILEISCIVVAGGAGLSLGRAILRPGSLSRRRSLAEEAIPAFQLAGGTALWLVLAGVVEGFASRTGLGPLPTSLIGITLGGVFWGLVLWRGRVVEEGLTAEPVAAP